MVEEWRDVVGYEGKYMVSNLGHVKSLNYRGHKGVEKLMTPQNNKGYFKIRLYKDGTWRMPYIHRLVADAFLDKKYFKYVDEQDKIDNLDLKNLEVNHIDKEGTWNNNVNNLEWCTKRYNVNYDGANERRAKTLKNSPLKSKIVYQYDLNMNLVKVWPSTMEIQRQLKYENSAICGCCNKRRSYKTYKGYIWSYEEL